MSDSSIITGQYVRINQTPANVWDRFLARFIDYVVMVVYLYANTFLITRLNISSNWGVVFAILSYVPVLAYDVLWETFNGGRSLGKMVLGLRVVKADGSTPGIGAFVMRWLFMLVEGTGLALLPMLLSRRTQRFGDMAAATMVIKERQYHALAVSLDEYSYLTADYKPTFPQVVDLTEEQVAVIERTLDPDTPMRGERMAQLAQKVKQVLAVESNKDDERFLFTVLHDYRYFEQDDI
jgi:uncharacterized RDD family membrane protein YckC